MRKGSKSVFKRHPWPWRAAMMQNTFRVYFDANEQPVTGLQHHEYLEVIDHAIYQSNELSRLRAKEEE